MVRKVIDTLLTQVTRIVLRGFFRSVEVQDAGRVPKDRPVLVVANHFNGFIDPVMLVHVIGRPPRFLAKATLWNIVWLRPLLKLAGLIPVHRRHESVDMSANVRSFEAAVRVLARRGVIGIFPEGRSHDEASVSRVHTGTARIALAARAAGVANVTIVAVGLTFDDKISLRSRVLAVVGPPIDVDAVGKRFGAVDGNNRAAVRALTDHISASLRSVAPDYRSFREAQVMAEAAEIALRRADDPRSGEVPLSEREQLARQLARAGPADRDEVTAAVAQYYLDLHISGLREEQVGSGFRASRLAARTLTTALAVTLMAPIAIIGAAWNAIPYAVVAAVGHVVDQPVRKGTARLSAALLLFPATWAVVAVTDPWPGLWTGVGVFVAAPLFGLVAVAAFERAVALYFSWRGWIGLAERRALLANVRASRARVVDAVRSRVGAEPAAARVSSSAG